MESRITIKDLPQDVQDLIRQRIVEHEEYQKLVKLRNAAVASGKYVKAMQYAKLMNEAEDLCAKEFVKHYVTERKLINELVGSMTEEDRLEMDTLGNLLTMIVDMLDTAVMDTNQHLKKYHPDFHIDLFDKLNTLGKEAKAYMKQFDAAKPDQFYVNLYGETADKLYEMSMNKSRSFVKKLMKHEEKVNKKAQRGAEVA